MLKTILAAAAALALAGPAAAQAVLRELRSAAPDLSTALVGDVAGINRTLVTKGILTGLLSPEQTALLLPTGVRRIEGPAIGLDVNDSRLRLLPAWRTLRYRALVVTTGSAPRPLRGPDLSVPVLHMHDPKDAEAVRTLLDSTGQGPVRVAVLGAGLVGAETAAALRDAGAHVHLVARSTLPLTSALGARLAGRVAALHREHLTAHLGVAVDHGLSTGRRRGIALDDGTELELDLVIAAQGTNPRTAWTKIGTRSGIRVDDRLRWRPRLYAAGGAAVHNTAEGHDYRIDHWDAATDQGRHAARAVLFDLGLGDDPGPYVPRSGYTVHFHGATLAGIGVAAPGAVPHFEGLADGAGITRFVSPSGQLVGAAALNAPSAVRELATEIARA